MHRGAHARIGPAAADVRHLCVNVGVGRMRIVREERDRRHDLPRLAIAALRRVGFDPGLLHRVQLLLAEALDCQDRLVGGLADRRDAGSCRLAVDDDGAGAAQSDAAAEFRSDHPQFVAQRPQQRHFRLDIDGGSPPIDEKIDHRPGTSICTEPITEDRHDCSRPGQTEVKLARGERFDWKYRRYEATVRLDLMARAPIAPPCLHRQ